MTYRNQFLIVLISVLWGCSTEKSDVRSSQSVTQGHDSDAVATDETSTGGTKDVTKDGPRQQLPQDEAHQIDKGEEGVDDPKTPGDEDDDLVVDEPEEPAKPLGPAVGMRNFRQINDTMASLTGVPRTNATVATAFAALETQLPDSNDLHTFNGSHQVAISKLAVEYCDAMVNDAALAAAAVPGFNFAAVPSVAFNAAGKMAVAEALIAKFWGSGLETLPPESETAQALSDLIDAVVAGKANTAAVTKNVVKGVCVSLLASTQVLIY